MRFVTQNAFCPRKKVCPIEKAPVIPTVLILIMSLSCGTSWKAFWKSKYIISLTLLTGKVQPCAAPHLPDVLQLSEELMQRLNHS